jgi:hypothetical protein
MSEIAWHRSLDEALNAARSADRFVLMDVFSPT